VYFSIKDIGTDNYLRLSEIKSDGMRVDTFEAIINELEIEGIQIETRYEKTGLPFEKLSRKFINKAVLINKGSI